MHPLFIAACISQYGPARIARRLRICHVERSALLRFEMGGGVSAHIRWIKRWIKRLQSGNGQKVNAREANAHAE
jgi:hypothetical protein